MNENSQQNSSFYCTSKILNNLNVETFLHNLQKKFVILPINEAANNFSFICKKFYILKNLNEIELKGTSSPACKCTSTTKDEITYENNSFSNNFGLYLEEKHKSLPII